MKKIFLLITIISFFSKISFSQETNQGRNINQVPKSITNNQKETKQENKSNTTYKGSKSYTKTIEDKDIRVFFDDTSAIAGYAVNDWLVEINSNEIDGTSHFAIQDFTNNTYPFKIIAKAPTNSLFINNKGNIGIGSNNPELKLQLTKGDTPGIRLEQDITSGWGAYTWDIAGNETNFFIRDITNGSTLPFRIMAGAPNYSIKIDKKGYTSLGKSTATERLDIAGNIHLDSILRISPISENPFDANEGDLYMDATDHILKLYTGEKWVTLSQERNIFLSNDYLIRGSDTLADFSNYIHNTDEQILTLTGNTLSISNGNEVDLSSLLVSQQEQIDELKQAVKDLQELISTITDDGNKIASEPNQSSVKQNNPNPFAYATEIPYYIEPTVTEALILVYTEQGKLIKKATIKERGQGVYQFNSTDIPSGIYFYSLIIDGVKINTLKMILM